MTRPVCAHCGQPYGKRHTASEIVRWDAPTKAVEMRDPQRPGKMRAVQMLNGEPPPPPPYRGNGIVVKESHPYLSADDGRMVMTRYIWDGQSWFGGYDPFCTLRCALDYARKAYRARMKGQPS